MSSLTGARLVGTFVIGAGGTTITFLVTGFNLNVEDRPQIDITSGADTVSHAVPGRRGLTTATINARFEATGNPALIAAELKQCADGTLTISAAATADCAAANIYSGDAWMTGFSIEGAMDTAVDTTLNFLLNVGES